MYSVTNVLEEIEKAMKETKDSMKEHYDIWHDEGVFKNSFMAGYLCAMEQVSDELKILIENGLP